MNDYQLWRYLEQFAELRNGWWYTITALPAIILAVSAYVLMIIAMRKQRNLAIAALWLLFAGIPVVLVVPSFYVSLGLGRAAQQIGFVVPMREQDMVRAVALELSAALDQVATLGIIGATLAVASMVASVMVGGYAPQLTRAIGSTVMTVTESVSRTMAAVTGVVGGGRKRSVRSPHGVLVVERSATLSGTEYAVRDTFVIGKKDADITITDSLVSRRHARLLVQNSQVSIEDLGSTNGTFIRRSGGLVIEVNGSPEALEDGDEVLLGPPDEPSVVVLRYKRGNS
ncbi:MAG: hypothetical protein KatS3mg055_3035 [Chloroflexus sp.]|uniref:FHA domain-containing protein n=1 Tax=Chloroflexus sp. TaxID=1904827 RepID=UPI0021DCF70A|nr:FHA domain-containing protein [Chloroflexus sp.]GIV90517.1 MAG: hypothetical protein KatS3mg055_3035 [Chloroflexus sp.]